MRNALGLPVAHVGGVGDGVYVGWVDWLQHFAVESRLWSPAQRDALHDYVSSHPHALSFCVDEAAQWCGKSPVQVARFVYLQTMASRADACERGDPSPNSSSSSGDSFEDDSGHDSDDGHVPADDAAEDAQLPMDVQCAALALMDGFLRPVIARLAARPTTAKVTRADVLKELKAMRGDGG